MRGQGLGPKIIKKLLKKAFEDLGLHRIELGVFAFNKSAIKSYKKIGFIKEGEKRDFRKLNGEYYNLWQMSMLESEWSWIILSKNSPLILIRGLFLFI